MIIRPHDGAWLVITQPDHAALAGRIMREWQEPALRDSPRREAILLAVTEHDNGWRETDASPDVDPASGQLLDFITIDAGVRQQVWPRAVARLAAVPYAAALVAQHAIHVYGRFRDDPAWIDFFETMEHLRDEQLQTVAPASLDELLADYQFVRIGDLISLVFCNAWQEPQEDGFGRRIHLDGSRVVITPDPFEGRTIDIEIEGSLLRSNTFASAADAREAYKGAASVAIHGTAAGA